MSTIRVWSVPPLVALVLGVLCTPTRMLPPADTVNDGTPPDNVTVLPDSVSVPEGVIVYEEG